MQANAPTRLWFGPYYRRSPFFEATQKAGALGYDVYNHMLLPAGYDDVESEYWQIKNHVAVWDVSVERNTEISGPDALAFTNLLTPRDLTKCRVWQCKYLVITDRQGGIINDPVLARVGENRFWLAAADSDLMLWAKGVAVHSGMDVQIREAEAYPIQIQGPKSRRVIQALFGDQILKLKYYYCMPAQLDGIPLVITRTGWTGEIGYEIYLQDAGRGLDLWDRVMEAGRAHHIKPTAPSDIRRIEAGILNYGSDMTIDTNPYEVGLGRLVELDQGAPFIGKDALRKIKAEGVRRKLVGIEIDGQPLPRWPERYWPIFRQDKQIGHVTAAVYSPGLRKNIGYALLPVASARLGTVLEIRSPIGELKAAVVRKPFVDPKKKIPKS